MKTIRTIIALAILLVLGTYNSYSEDSIVSYSYFQITNAWYLTQTDTLDITETFSDDYYFAFFIENDEGQRIFTVRGYSNEEIFCLGTVTYLHSEKEGEYNADVFSTEVYCDKNQEVPAQSILLENIPGSLEDTGFNFYYIWVVFNPNEAIVFQCFDATTSSEEQEDDAEDAPV